MHHPRNRFQRLISTGAIAFAVMVASGAQVPSRVFPDTTLLRSNRNSANEVRVVMDGARGTRSNSLVKRAVRDRDGHQLGTVKDAYVATHSGKSVYLAVSDPADNTLRVAPFAAIGQQNSGDALTLNISRKEWQQIAPASVPSPDATRLAISEADGRQLTELFGETVEDVASGALLIAIGELRGKQVSTGTDIIGTIDEVVVDGRGVAAASVAPDKGFSTAGGKYILPLYRFNLGAHDLNPIRTNVTRSDLERAATN